MIEQLYSIFRRLRGRMFGFFAICMVMGIFSGLTPQVSHAQNTTPPANTTIGNQASATYTDNAGNQRTVTSNTVATIVQQVAAVSISQGINKTVNPGGQVSFPYTLTNNGNGTDSFDLTTAEGTGDYDFDNIAMYADANGDGIPDDINAPITTTPEIAAGNQFNFVIVADLPGGVTNGNTETIDITATSIFDDTVSNTQTNTVIVSINAVIDVIKSTNPSNGSPGDTITITLTFTNNGNSDGTNLVLNDPLPVGFTYVDASGQWSGSGAALTDADDGDEGGITYNFDSGNRTVSATVAQLNAGQQGTLTFQITVDGGTGGQAINNTANYTHDDLTGTQNTNTSSFQVNKNYGVATVIPDTVSQGPVNQGATIDYINEFTNTGSTSDRYNITLDNSTFPEGTTFTLYRSDGNGNAVNPLTDSNNDGILDVGPIAAGNDFQIILRVALASNASGGPFTVDKTAASVGNPDQNATHTDQLTAISSSSVDLTNNSAGSGAPGAGVNPTGEDSPVTTNTTNPATSTTFTLFVNNTSGQQDNYNLAVSTDNTFGSKTLPSGWTVQFRNTNGNAITNTGSIAAGANKQINAIITISAGAVPSPSPGTSIYFRALSASSGASDVKHDAVIINTLRKITLATNQNGQIAPGGSKIYTHTLTNAGNVNENDGTNSAIELVLANSAPSGFTALVYVDNNGNGQIDSDDEQVVSAGNSANLPASVGVMAPGDQVQLLVKITAGSGVNSGTTNTPTLTAQDDGTDSGVNGENLNTANVQDITTVVVGNMEVRKLQSSDGTSYGTQNINAGPGDIIYYRLVVTNQGSAAVTDVTITDSTPAYTTQLGTVSVSGNGSPSIDSDPGDGNTGIITVSSASLGAGQSFIIEFSVQIDNQ